MWGVNGQEAAGQFEAFSQGFKITSEFTHVRAQTHTHAIVPWAKLFLFITNFSSLSVKSVNNSHLGRTAAVGLGRWCMKCVGWVCAYRLLNIKRVLCKQVKQLEPGLHCLRLHRAEEQDVEVRFVAPGEALRDVVRMATKKKKTNKQA